MDYTQYTLLVFSDCKIKINLPEFVKVIQIDQKENQTNCWAKSSPFRDQAILVRPDSYIEWSVGIKDPNSWAIKSYLRDPVNFIRGPGFPIPLTRDTEEHPEYGFTVLDGYYLSARWPGDAHRFAQSFLDLLSHSESLSE